MRSKIMLFEQIRRDSRVEGLSVRALAKRHRVHRRTVRQALASATPPESARRKWVSRKIDPFMDEIDGMLRSDLCQRRPKMNPVASFGSEPPCGCLVSRWSGSLVVRGRGF